jgi:hypothetical protein
MLRLVWILSLLSLLSTTAVTADEAAERAEVKRIPAHNPEWTSPNNGDPGTTKSVIPELQKIVVLCATVPQSDEFKNQWSAYVRRHYEPGMNIDVVIYDVIRRANAFLAGPKQSGQSAARLSVQSNAATRKVMHDTAMSIIRNVK